ncbi:MAG: response regulator [Pseudomonadota bacterium]|nr:response regulator [Pseudomonadota bacterium]
MPEARATESKPMDVDGQLPIGSRYVRALLNRHGVPSMRHVTLIAEVLEFRYTLVHRRMKGEVAWELEEIEKVAAYFGESLASVFATERQEDFVAAVLAIEGARVDCQLLLGDVVRDPDRNQLVAIKVGAQWVVVAASQAGVGPAFEVRQMVVSGDADRRRRIAVLDDDAGEAASMAQHFSDRGCEAQAFSDVEALVGHMKLRPFDAYVIDWVLDEGTAAELVAMIRSDDRECPIAVLTGKMEQDVRVESAVAEALSTYKLMFFQKPTRLPLISSQLLRALAGQ